MMIVDAKSILKRLTRSCTNALNAAAAQCVNARQYEVTLEHVMLALLDDADSDIAFLVMHYDLDPARLRKVLQNSLEDLRTGNAGKPTFSPTMLEWIQDAWLVGSAEYGYQKVRSGLSIGVQSSWADYRFVFGRKDAQPLKRWVRHFGYADP